MKHPAPANKSIRRYGWVELLFWGGLLASEDLRCWADVSASMRLIRVLERSTLKFYLQLGSRRAGRYADEGRRILRKVTA